jgi:hypothetical protein
LQRLSKLPSWLRRYALSASSIQDIVQYETIQAPAVALILLNGIIFGAFLTLFQIEVDVIYNCTTTSYPRNRDLLALFLFTPLAAATLPCVIPSLSFSFSMLAQLMVLD